MLPSMPDELPMEALEGALHRLGVEVREEPLSEELGTTGGLCVIRGRRVVLVAAGAPPWRRAEVLLDALRRLDTEDVWLPPAIRRKL